MPEDTRKKARENPGALLDEAQAKGTEKLITDMEADGQADLVRESRQGEWARLPIALTGTDRFGSAHRAFPREEDFKDFEDLGFEFHPEDRERALRHGIEESEAWAEFQKAPSVFGRKPTAEEEDEYEAASKVYYEAKAKREAEWDDPLFLRAKLPEGWVVKGLDHAMHSSILDADGFERVMIFYKAAFYDRRAHASLNTAPTNEVQDKVLSRFYDDNHKHDYGEPGYWSGQGREVLGDGPTGTIRTTWKATWDTGDEPAYLHFDVTPEGEVTEERVAEIPQND